MKNCGELLEEHRSKYDIIRVLVNVLDMDCTTFHLEMIANKILSKSRERNYQVVRIICESQVEAKIAPKVLKVPAWLRCNTVTRRLKNF